MSGSRLRYAALTMPISAAGPVTSAIPTPNWYTSWPWTLDKAEARQSSSSSVSLAPGIADLLIESCSTRLAMRDARHSLARRSLSDERRQSEQLSE